MRYELRPDMDGLRALLLARVDEEAEAARRRFLTGGAGQALEYEATRREAEAYLNGGEGWFPFLEAEAEASGRDLAAVATEVTTKAHAWAVAGAEIKGLRRVAKIAIAAAQTPAEAEAAAIIAWPSP